jgi:hypothetical protein
MKRRNNRNFPITMEKRQDSIEVTQSEQQREDKLKKEKKTLTLRDLWHYNKKSNFCIIKVLGRMVSLKI